MNLQLLLRQIHCRMPSLVLLHHTNPLQRSFQTSRIFLTPPIHKKHRNARLATPNGARSRSVSAPPRHVAPRRTGLEGSGHGLPNVPGLPGRQRARRPSEEDRPCVNRQGQRLRRRPTDQHRLHVWSRREGPLRQEEPLAPTAEEIVCGSRQCRATARCYLGPRSRHHRKYVAHRQGYG